MDKISSHFTLDNLDTFKYSFKPLLQYMYNYKPSVQPYIDHSRPPVSRTCYNYDTLVLSVYTSCPKLDPSDHYNHTVAQSQSPSGLQSPSDQSPNTLEGSLTECCGDA